MYYTVLPLLTVLLFLFLIVKKEIIGEHAENTKVYAGGIKYVLPFMKAKIFDEILEVDVTFY